MSTDTLIVIGVIGGAIALAILGVALRMTRQEREAKVQPPASQEAASPTAGPSAPVEALPVVLPETAPPPATLEPATAIEPVPAVEPDPIVEAARPESVAPPLPSVPPAAVPAGEIVEVMRVLREPGGGALLVEMEGQRYRTVNEIKDQKHGLGLVDALMDLQRFLGLDVVASLAAAEPSQAAIAPAAEPMSLQKPSYNPIKQMMILRDRELKKSREKREGPPQPATIVEEIEAILVKRIPGSPFEGRSIHMRPGLHGGAHIDVDGRGFASIDDLTDMDVKEFLRSVIADWEAGIR